MGYIEYFTYCRIVIAADEVATAFDGDCTENLRQGCRKGNISLQGDGIIPGTPVVQPPVAMSVLADAMASAKVQVLSSTVMFAACVVPAVHNASHAATKLTFFQFIFIISPSLSIELC